MYKNVYVRYLLQTLAVLTIIIADLNVTMLHNKFIMQAIHSVIGCELDIVIVIISFLSTAVYVLITTGIAGRRDLRKHEMYTMIIINIAIALVGVDNNMYVAMIFGTMTMCGIRYWINRFNLL